MEEQNHTVKANYFNSSSSLSASLSDFSSCVREFVCVEEQREKGCGGCVLQCVAVCYSVLQCVAVCVEEQREKGCGGGKSNINDWISLPCAQ